MLEISTYSADQIKPLLSLLEEWLQREFFQYPYLWLPPKGETNINNMLLLAEEHGLVTVVRKGQQVVGIAAGVPFDSDTVRTTLNSTTGKDQTLFEKTKKLGFDPSKLFYMNYFLTASEYRNNKELVDLIYNHYVDFARKIGKTQLCYLEYSGESEHPLKPEHLTPIEPWGHVIHGFKRMHMQADITWPTVQLDGSARDESHTVEFFIKDI
jgi:hypothetical protein